MELNVFQLEDKQIGLTLWLYPLCLRYSYESRKQSNCFSPKNIEIRFAQCAKKKKEFRVKNARQESDYDKGSGYLAH